MPPEPLPWDRKDFFKERKHERSEQHHPPHPHPHQIGGGGGFGGVGGFGGGPRWREPLHPHPHPYHYASPRWASSDFRYRPPHGYGKHSGRNPYPEETSHGFMSSRPNDKTLDDESYRASGSGKYSRNNRESRSSFSQKDWKGHTWEATPSPNGPGRPNDVSDQPRSVDDMHTCNSSNPHSDSANSWDQPQSKDQHEKNGGVNATASSGPRFERESSLGSWKPLNKWTRSGSLSSRGSGFSHSSSSKSMGADSSEMKVEVQPINVTPINSPSGDAAPAAACEMYVAPSEETNSRKKPRLGWGEGLAKYEKKKVVCVDDTAAAKNGVVICSSNREPVNLLSSSLADKSPGVTGFSDCASPATPSSVGCSSSPGMEEKQFVKAGTVEQETTNSMVSPGIVSQTRLEDSSFNLENLDLAPITSLNSAINELLQVDDLSSVDSGFVKSTAISKLLVWKGDVLKALELTESEIDKLEGELKLISEPGTSGVHPVASTSLALDCHPKPADDQDAASDITPGQSPLELVSSGGNDVGEMQHTMEVDHAEAKDDNVDSPGSATSKFVEIPTSGKDVSVTQLGGQRTQSKGFEDLGVKCSECTLNEDKGAEVYASCDGSNLVADGSSTHADDFSLLCDYDNKLCESILASNREIANRAAEVFNKLLPPNQSFFDISSAAGVSCPESTPLIKERLMRRKSSLRLKERVISLKFRALHHLWKDDIRSLSIRKFRVKSQKKFDLSVRAVNGSNQKHRLSIRRLSSAGSLNLTATPETTDFLSKLISDSQFKPLRNTLKMPALILDEREKMVSRFISTNGLVEDPCGVEKERSMINPWTAEEKEIFMDKLATYGKDFKKIASFLMHKTTADCVEFYYKNHKSDCFKQTKEHSGFVKQGKAQSTNNYLVASGKRWNRECNAASLDILGAASAIAANIEVGMEIQQKCSSKYLAGLSSNCQTSRGNVAVLERSSSLDGDNTDKETVAADVLAGICGSLSSEAMGSCITSAVDPGEGYHEWKCQKVGSTSRWPPTPEVTQSIDDETCSDESCGEMDPTDWTDEEKSIFVQAVSSYGKDFTMISRCIRTRSRDQCRVFFSKARKCLGLDMICPGSGNTDVVRNEANGAGSETDDACVVEAVSHMCSVKSGVGTEDLPSPDVKLNKEPDCVVEAVSHMCSVKSGVGTEDLPSPDVKLNKEPDVAGTVTVQPDINRIEKGTGDLEHVDNAHQPMSKSDDSLVEKPELDVDGDVAMCMGPSSSRSVAVQDEGTGLASSGEVGNENTGEANDRPDRSDAEINVGAVDKVAEHHRGETDASVQGIPEIGMDVDKDDAAPSKASGRDEEVKSNPEVYTADMGSSSGCDGVSGDQQQAELETESAEQPCAIALPENSYSMPTSSASDAPVAVKCTNGLVEHTSPATNIGSTSEGGSQASRPGEQHLSKGSLMDGVESSRILKGCYLLPVSTIKQVSGDGISKRSATLQSIPKSDKNFHDDRNSSCDTYLRKCNGAKQPTSTSVSELPCQSQPQSTDNIHISSSSDSEKPHRNGDFKLFGQILVKPSSQQKATSSTQQNGNNENQHLKIGKSVVAKFSGGDQSVNGNSIQTKLVRNNFIGPENLHVRSYGGDQSVNGNSIQTKLDRNNFIGPENLPVRSYGLWNAGRTQNGFSSLPDSAMLLAKYPAAFSSFATPMEQLPLQGMNGGGERSLNGPTFAARDIDSSNGADFQVYSNREAQPFTLDVKQRQDMLLPDVQRRNGFDVVSGMQQAAGGMVGMNVGGRGGILVGGQCNSNGVSDPVAAIKMHYAQVEQFNGQAGNNIMRDDDSWRGKSNIGR